MALAVAASGAALQAETAGAAGKKRAKVSANTSVTARSTGAKSSVRTGTAVNTRRNVATGNNFRQRNLANSNAVANRSNLRTNRVKTTSSSNVVARHNKVRANREANVSTNRNRVVNRENRVNRVNRANNVEVNRNNNVTVNRTRNINRTRNVNVNRNRNVVVTNNWRSERFSGARYAAFRNYHRSYHNHDWWHNHYSTVVLIGGGYWAFNSGYWYPAWGYNSGYSYYPYDGPIYTGAATLTPAQVTVAVQTQLARDGYYNGPIDGMLGPNTRQAIADFQADNGLAVTASIDEPTLDELGVA